MIQNFFFDVLVYYCLVREDDTFFSYAIELKNEPSQSGGAVGDEHVARETTIEHHRARRTKVMTARRDEYDRRVAAQPFSTSTSYTTVNAITLRFVVVGSQQLL